MRQKQLGEKIVMSRISIIVPVYKVEAYLRRCVDSICAQTFPDFELILVDDGSPDSCGAICDAYAEQDSRVHVIHRKNGGLSAARNTGIEWALENSSSEWITFIDSDDWINKEYLQCLYSAAALHNSMISACDFEKVKNDAADPVKVQESVMLSASELYRSYYYVAQSAVCKLYHKSLFVDRTFRFPEGILHEDSAIVYQILFQQGNIAFCPNKLYYYYQREESITGTGWNPKRMIYCDVQNKQLQWLQAHGYGECVRTCLLHFLEALHYNEHQIHRTSEYSEYARKMRRISRMLIRKYGKKYRISVKEYPALFETGYPRTMAMYWFLAAQLQKIKGEKR